MISVIRRFPFLPFFYERKNDTKVERNIYCFRRCNANEKDKITPLIIGKTRCFKEEEFKEIISPFFKEALGSVNVIHNAVLNTYVTDN